MTYFPQSEREVSEILAGAGSGVRVIGGGSSHEHFREDTSAEMHVAGLSGISIYEPASLTLVAKAGTRLADIDAVLATANQQLAFEPRKLAGLLGLAGDATLGGIAASNNSGPRRVQAGACRDHLIGLRFVDGAGTVIKSGGRVMKNVTGLDLVKLLAGSFGTLGVITEVALRVLPKPEVQANVVVQGCDDETAITMLSKGLGSAFGVTGAAHFSGQRQTVFRLEGFESSVVYRAKKLQDLLGADCDSEVSLDQSAVAAIWQSIRDVSLFAGKAGAVWRVSVKPTTGPKFVEMLRESTTVEMALFDLGGGLIWLLLGDDGDAGLAAIKAALLRLGGGSASLVRAGNATRRRCAAAFVPANNIVTRIEAGLREKFDPRQTFVSERQSLEISRRTVVAQ